MAESSVRQFWVRRVLLLIAGGTWQVALAFVLQKGWLNDIPDWIVVALCLAPVVALVVWVVIHEKTRKHVYTSPVISFTLFVVVGTALGFLVSAFIWWALYTPHGDVAAQQANQNQPSSSTMPLVLPSPSPSPSMSPSDAKPSKKQSKAAAERQRRKAEALKALDYRKP